MEINPLGVLLAVMLFSIVFFLGAFILIQALFHLRIIRYISLRSRLLLSALLAVVAMIAAYSIRRAYEKNDITPVETKLLNG